MKMTIVDCLNELKFVRFHKIPFQTGIKRYIQKMALAVLIFSESFGLKVTSLLKRNASSSLLKKRCVFHALVLKQIVLKPSIYLAHRIQLQITKVQNLNYHSFSDQ